MPAIATAPALEDLVLTIHQEIHVNAPLEVTFETLLEQLGPLNEREDGVRMALKIEPWPGGRWFRDLGDNNGHFWGQVQAIKRPTLLEIAGPLMMSYPVANNVQYRLSEHEGGTLIKFHHLAFGLVDDAHRQNLNGGWSSIHERVRNAAEAKRRQ
jgi:hypothetical protein